MIGKERGEWMGRERRWLKEDKEAMEDLLISYKVKSWLTTTVVEKPLLNRA
jgi:hypothetical protein